MKFEDVVQQVQEKLIKDLSNKKRPVDRDYCVAAVTVLSSMWKEVGRNKNAPSTPATSASLADSIEKLRVVGNANATRAKAKPETVKPEAAKKTRRPNGHWDKYKNCLEEASKYNSRTEWVKGSQLSYANALKHGWKDKIAKKLEW